MYKMYTYLATAHWGFLDRRQYKQTMINEFSQQG